MMGLSLDSKLWLQMISVDKTREENSSNFDHHRNLQTMILTDLTKTIK